MGESTHLTHLTSGLGFKVTQRPKSILSNSTPSAPLVKHVTETAVHLHLLFSFYSSCHYKTEKQC